MECTAFQPAGLHRPAWWVRVPGPRTSLSRSPSLCLCISLPVYVYLSLLLYSLLFWFFLFPESLAKGVAVEVIWIA